MKTAFLFPGQGAQAVGMGKDIYDAYPAARAVFEEAQQISNLPLAKLAFEGPQEELNRTDIAQPAIFAVSAAMLACMNEVLGPQKMQKISPVFMAGLSLGEYTALYAAGAMDFETTMELVVRRGWAMQSAAVSVPSGMVSVMGLDEDKARQLCEAASGGEVLTCANFNCPGQIVISGQTQACKRAEEMAKDFGASGAVALKVAGAFHSQIMKPAAQELSEALAMVQFQTPRVTVIANVDAKPYECACSSQDKLLAQLTGSVRWQQSVEYLLAQGVEKFYEIGPGRVLAGLMRRINGKEALEKLAAEA